MLHEFNEPVAQYLTLGCMHHEFNEPVAKNLTLSRMSLLEDMLEEFLVIEGQSLTFNQTLISKGGKFELGFFTPGTSLNYYYIGIWYKNIPNKTVVWVANRDIPLTDPSSSEFKLLENGNLVLLNQSKFVIWSTESASNGNVSSQVMLGDDGNFVLRTGVRPSHTIWQSFDCPTDTILPGAKIGYNRITKMRQSLTSWRRSIDPAKGLYSVEPDPDRDEYFIKSNQNQNRSWSSGTWNGILFSLIPEMRLRYVKNENESYFTCDVFNSSIPFRLMMSWSGQLQHFEWAESIQSWNLFWSSQPRQYQCEAYLIYGYCGSFSVCDQNNLPLCRCLNWGFKPQSPKDWNLSDFSGGCVRINNLQCKDEVGFLQDYQQNGFFNQLLNDAIKTADDCKQFCLDDYSCNAYAFNSSCLLWKRDEFVRPPLQKDPLQKDEGQPAVYIQLRVAASMIQSSTSVVPRPTSGEHEPEQGKLDLPLFDFNAVAIATNNFSNKLGEGGFGPVYKLLDEREIAVKRLSRSSGQGLQEFKNELMLISKLQHRNLVRLLGYCIGREEKILFYEYMPNKSLDAFLFDPTKHILLDWSKRFRIIDGVARGLLYLHRDSRLKVIHRDLKTSNILLDEDMNLKISDFGLARIFGGKQILANTSRVVGTYRYMSPEYAMEGIFSEKSDVFSFVVLLLEIVSSKKNNNFYLLEESYNLLGYVWLKWKENKVLEIMDPTLAESYNIQQLMRCIHIGLLCVQDHALDRPTMSAVVSMLGSEGTLPLPKQPAFTIERSQFSKIHFNINDAVSINSVTLTNPVGR
ncbi:hypothetical protein AQUCO_00300361v1 [Aquilegia coerulea]|uniref:Receptor-like serine/threonine-protein kinase n=1 Tax=Aquilegia coerulea TaxID=218851 RepID=A0A2G5EYR8_AQUCA|nr:hypothetical protein AQUCO_00300361v1 [Aquilegia coerulea]